MDRERILPPNHYRGNVTSITPPTFEELMASYDVVSLAWRKGQANDESLLKFSPAVGEKIFLLKKFDETTIYWAVINDAEEKGYRAPFPCEREAFTKANPHLQGEGEILDPGGITLYDEHVLMPSLFVRNDGKRVLGQAPRPAPQPPGVSYLLVLQEGFPPIGF